jgi:energy-coupling factor transporter transmembrane protein EcfT
VNRRRVGPLSLLAASLLPVAGVFAIDSARTGLLAVGIELVALGWLVSDLRTTLVRASYGLVAAFGIALTTWLYAGQDLELTALAATRILYLVLPSALAMPLVQPSVLGDHLAQRLHLPARLVVAAVASLQRIDSLAEDWRQIQRARRSRGVGLDGGPVRRVRASAGSAFALLVVAMRQAGHLAEAMDARGFADAGGRTWAEPAPWHPVDSLVLTLAVALAALPWLLR